MLILYWTLRLIFDLYDVSLLSWRPKVYTSETKETVYSSSVVQSQSNLNLILHRTPGFKPRSSKICTFFNSNTEIEVFKTRPTMPWISQHCHQKLQKVCHCATPARSMAAILDSASIIISAMVWFAPLLIIRDSDIIPFLSTDYANFALWTCVIVQF